jgi:hypothetical protein
VLQLLSLAEDAALERFWYAVSEVSEVNTMFDEHGLLTEAVLLLRCSNSARNTWRKFPVLNTTVPSRFMHIVGSNFGKGETTSNEV